MMSRKLLVVEDDRDIRKSMERLLQSEGYAVEMAENGLEALNLLQNGSALPQLIILDLMMPQMDGFQFREEQAKNAKISHIPVIVMTADGHIDEKKVRANAVAALRKPADIDVILNTIKKHCP